jgi:hypothetical protein
MNLGCHSSFRTLRKKKYSSVTREGAATYCILIGDELTRRIMSLKNILPIFLTASGLASAVTINVGVEGFDAGLNNWPGGEPPSAAIDGAASTVPGKNT